MQRLLDTYQAAERLGLARSSLAKLRLYGGGPQYLKLGAKVLYPEDAIDAWLAAKVRHTSTTTSAQPLAG
jgi:predicted DNA-binding transcriptional regulator AlpA